MSSDMWTPKQKIQEKAKL